MKSSLVSHNYQILIAQSIAVGFLLWVISGWIFPFTTDSMVYITTALNFAHFKGLLYSNFFVQNPTIDVLPLSIWPPGYPICIAILKWMGINEYVAALIIPRVSCLAFPFLFFSIFKRFVPDNISLFASGLCSLTFSVVSCSSIAWSDAPYLALSLLVLVMVFNIIEKNTSVHWSFIVLSGILSGIAFLFRYIGVSLVSSVGLCLIIGLVLRVITFRNFIRMGGLYGFGVCMPLVPYFIRNLVVFKMISVYLSPLPNSNFFFNLAIVVNLYFKGLSSMIFGVSTFAWIIPVFILSFVLWFIVRAKELLKQAQAKFICLFLILVYFFVHSFFMIYYRAKVLLVLNPDVNERLLMQVSWILVGGAVIALHAAIKRWYGTKRFKFFWGGLVLLFVLIQVFQAMAFHKQQIAIKNLAVTISHYFPLPSISPDYVIISNVPEITYYFAGRNVRGISNYTPYYLITQFGIFRKYIVFLVKGCGYLTPAWVYADEWKNPEGFKRFYSDANVDFFIPEIKYRMPQVRAVNKR